MRKFVVALFLVMLVSAVAGHFHFPVKKAKEVVPVVHAGWWGDCSYCDKPIPPDCFCEKVGDVYRKTKISYTRKDSFGCHCYWVFCSDTTKYCDAQCTDDASGGCSGTQTDQCQTNQDCGSGKYCCATDNGNICRDCPCNQNSCGGGGGGGGGCDVSAPSGLGATASYNYSVITWTPGTNSHQELLVDADKSKVDGNCANGCLVKRTDLGSSVNQYTASNLQPGTKYYYKIRSVKDCGHKSAEDSFTTIPPLSVPKVKFINRQQWTTKDPPAVVRCYVNHNDNGAIYAVADGHNLQRLGNVLQGRDGLFVPFLPDFSVGSHTVQCKVDRSKAMGSGNSGSYAITGPSVQVDAENSVIGLPVEVDANISSDFYVNRSKLYVDGSAVREGNYASQHSFSVANTWMVPLLPGKHEIKVVAKDYVGNTKAASTTVNVSDAAVSCAISPSTIDGDTVFSVSCYDMSASHTPCPDMDIYLQDSRAGIISGTHFDMNETYDGITSLVADAGTFNSLMLRS